MNTTQVFAIADTQHSHTGAPAHLLPSSSSDFEQTVTKKAQSLLQVDQSATYSTSTTYFDFKPEEPFISQEHEDSTNDDFLNLLTEMLGDCYPTSSSSLAQQAEANANQQLLLGTRLVEAKQYDLALKVFQSGLQNLEAEQCMHASDETNAQLYLWCGRLWIESNSFATAIACCTKGLALKALREETRIQLNASLGIAYLQDGQYYSAVVHLKRALSAEIVDAEIKARWYTNLAQAYLKKGDAVSAKVVLENAIRLPIDMQIRAPFLLSLGSIELANNLLHEAAQNFKAVLNAESGVADQLKAQAAFLLSQVRLKKAFANVYNASKLNDISLEMKKALNNQSAAIASLFYTNPHK